MKRLTACFLILCVLCACSAGNEGGELTSNTETEQTTEKVYIKASEEQEMRAVWISCYELPNASGGESEFREEISAMFSNVKSSGFNTVFVHVRPFADAVYPSEVYPWSKYVCSGKNPGFDPLEVMTQCARELSLSFHAWINPFRISLSSDTDKIPDNSPAVDMLKNGDAVVLDNGIYFNPASTAVHALIYDGVREILDNYGVDGIHIDDYFYPSADEKIDKKQFEQYVSSGGEKSLGDWRRDSVSAFAAGLYSLVKSYGEDKIFSISPAGNLNGNSGKLFADVSLWLSCDGYADIIIPQLYFGFENSSMPFEKTAEQWSRAATNDCVRIVWGLAPYKCGKTDKNAGAGEEEWVENNDILSRQLECVRALDRYDGFALFSYSYIFQQKSNENLKKEMQTLENML